MSRADMEAEIIRLTEENAKLRANRIAAEELANVLDRVTGKQWAAIATMEDCALVDAALARYRAITGESE